MRCIIVDDEPIARLGIKKLLECMPALELQGSFENAEAAEVFINGNHVDLIFLDIQMPGITGIEFAQKIPRTTLVIFTTAYTEFALDSYEVDAVDYLVKPIKPERFEKAVEKAMSYYEMLHSEERKNQVEQVEHDYIFIKSDRRFFKVSFNNILFIEGLKDYVVIQTDETRLITHMNVKTIHDLLPHKMY